MVAKKKETQNAIVFKAGDFVVYPTHGVGQVTGVEKETIAGHALKLVVVTFDDMYLSNSGSSCLNSLI